MKNKMCLGNVLEEANLNFRGVFGKSCQYCGARCVPDMRIPDKIVCRFCAGREIEKGQEK